MQGKKRALCLSVAAVCLLLLGSMGPVLADEVEDLFQEAIKSYQSGDLSDAATALDDAAQMVRQQKAKKMEPFLPKPLAGWEDGGNAVPPVSHAAVTAHSYMKESSVIQVIFLSDARSDEAFGMQFFESQGGRLERVGKQRASVQYDPKERGGQIAITVEKRVLVIVRGENVEKDDMTAYAKAIDFEQLAALK